MDELVKMLLNKLSSKDDRERMGALKRVLELTESKVVWIYEAWDGLFALLNDQNSFKRSIAVIVLCNLAKSDHEERLHGSLDLILKHTRDEKFVTSRQCLQNIWKIALTGRDNYDRIVSHLEKRFSECANEKHYNLLRQDIIQSFRNIYDSTGNEKVLNKARGLLLLEKEDKYRKRYEAILLL